MRHLPSLYAAGLVRDLLSQIGVSPRRLRRWTDLPVLVAIYDGDFLAALERSSPIAPSLTCALRQLVISMSMRTRVRDVVAASDPTPHTGVGVIPSAASSQSTNSSARSSQRRTRRHRDVPGQQLLPFA